MNKIKSEPHNIDANESNSKCRYCQSKISPENEPLMRIDYRDTEILNLKQQVQFLKLELDEKNAKL
jgi:ribosomal protein S18